MQQRGDPSGRMALTNTAAGARRVTGSGRVKDFAPEGVSVEGPAGQGEHG